MTSREKFDVITSDLVDPWVKGTAALFTREFFESMKQHLSPGGVVTMFVQLYMSNRETVKSEVETFMDVFPHAIVWGNTMEGQGYDLVLTGQAEPVAIDIDEMQARLEPSRPRPGCAVATRDRGRLGHRSALELRRVARGSRAVAARRGRQSGPQPSAAVLCRLGRDPAAEWSHLRRDGPAGEVPAGLFRGSPASMQAVRARDRTRDGAGNRNP